MINKEELKKINGYISERNQETLQKYIGKLAGDRIVVGDIGTMAGLSALTMASVSPNIHVLTVDPEEASKIVNESARMLGLQERVTFFNMTSTEFGRNHCPVLDACFIDGRHEKEGVDEDIRLIVAKVRKGGYIMFHDKNLYDFGPIIDKYEGKLYKFIEEEPQEIEPKSGKAYGSVYVGQRL